jgi:hypothetical protein
MTHSINVHNNLAAAHAGKDSPLSKLISARTKPQYPAAVEHAALWPADWWGFDQCDAFLGLNENGRSRVVQTCNRGLVNEAYFIEKSGLAYTAKMVLLAQDTDTAQLYALIGADEAKHLAWLEPYVVQEDKTAPQGFFLSFLSNLIEKVSPRLLVLLVQIVLEGWGLDHYRRLAQGCTDKSLAAVFSNILKDEALHHQSGNLLFRGDELSADDLWTVEKALRVYTDLVKTGPVAAVESLASVVELNERALVQALGALRHEQESARKLSLLRSLMNQPGIETVIDKLDKDGCFQPLAVDAAAKAIFEHVTHQSVGRYL